MSRASNLYFSIYYSHELKTFKRSFVFLWKFVIFFSWNLSYVAGICLKISLNIVHLFDKKISHIFNVNKLIMYNIFNFRGYKTTCKERTKSRGKHFFNNKRIKLFRFKVGRKKES